MGKARHHDGPLVDGPRGPGLRQSLDRGAASYRQRECWLKWPFQLIALGIIFVFRQETKICERPAALEVDVVRRVKVMSRHGDNVIDLHYARQVVVPRIWQTSELLE